MKNLQEEIVALLVTDKDFSAEEQKLIVDFLKSISEDSTSNALQVLAKGLKEKQQDWLGLKAKIIFVGKMKASKKFSEQVKKTVTEQIVKMSNEEFKVFINSFENAVNETDIRTKTKKLSEKQGKLHEEILALSSDVLGQVLICKSKVQEKKDKIKVANIIQKINSLKF